MLRNFAKTAFACAYSWSGIGRFLAGRTRPDASVVPFIVGYHRVVENFERSARTAIPSMLITTSMFEKHIEWLARRYRLVSIDDIGLHLESDRQFRRPTAAITFDDGYSDMYLNAFPILRRKGIPAAVFAVTDLVGTGRLQVFDKLYLLLVQIHSRNVSLARSVSAVLCTLGFSTVALEQLPAVEDHPFGVMTVLLATFPRHDIERVIEALGQRTQVDQDILEELSPLTWEMITEMQQSGITIGSHTKSHALLTNESLERAHIELTGSKAALEERLRTPIRHFAYPDGRFNPAILNAVKSAGYRYAYTICRSRHPHFPLLTIPRKVLWERSCLNGLGGFSSAVMDCHTSWAFDKSECSEHEHAMHAAAVMAVHST